MLSNLSARHFKGFDYLELSDLRTLNVIVGRSAAGKTTLLEAIKVAVAAQPQVLWNLTAQRGGVFLSGPPSREQMEGIWSQWFTDFDTKLPIIFALQNDRGQAAQVVIRFDNQDGIQTATLELPGINTFTSGVPSFSIERTDYDGEATVLRAMISSQFGLQFEGGPEIDGPSEFFPATQGFGGQPAATWFSNLSIENRERALVKIVRDQFPEIRDISVQSPAGISTLYATLKHMQRKIPLGSVSAGITKFLSLLVSLEQYTGGAILIDEIENGIYYEVFEPLWNSIVSLARRNKTQVFVSTHSMECLRGLLPMMRRYPRAINVIQVHQEGGRSRAYVVPAENAQAAIDTGIELRV